MTLKGLLMAFLLTAVDPKSGSNPFWDAMGFVPGPDLPVMPTVPKAQDAEESLSTKIVDLQESVFQDLKVDARTRSL